MNLSLSVERLILEGIPLGPEAIPALEASLVNELSRLLGQRDLDPWRLAISPVHQLRLGSLVLEEDNDPKRLGAQIARAVYTGLCTLGDQSPQVPERGQMEGG